MKRLNAGSSANKVWRSSGSFKRNKWMLGPAAESARVVTIPYTEIVALVTQGLSSGSDLPVAPTKGSDPVRNREETSTGSNRTVATIENQGKDVIPEETATGPSQQECHTCGNHLPVVPINIPVRPGDGRDEDGLGSSVPEPKRAIIKRSWSNEQVPSDDGCMATPKKTRTILSPTQRTQNTQPQNSHLNVVVAPKDWRELTMIQYSIIRRALEVKHTEVVNDVNQVQVPAFERFPCLAQGGLKFSCSDDFTLNWLIGTVDNLPPLWEDWCDLTTVAMQAIPKFVRCTIWVPDVAEPSFEAVKLHLTRLNSRWVDMSRWCHVRHEFRRDRCNNLGATLVMRMPESDLKIIEQRQFRLSYKTGAISVKIAQAGSALAAEARSSDAPFIEGTDN